jgi:hypothetical protein
MICSSVNRDRFIVRLPRWDGLYSNPEEIQGSRQWRALIPPEGEAHGSDPDAAKFAVSNSLTHRLRANGATPPRQRELTQIATDREWMSRNDVDFSKAIVAAIPASG